MKKILSVIMCLICVAALTFGLVGCGGNGENGGGGDKTQDDYSIVLGVSRIKIERFSDYQMTATLKKGEETVTGETLSWSSNDTTVVTVSQSGLITGVNEGETTVVCSFGTVQAVCTVTVGGYEIKLEISNKQIEMPFEENYSFDLTVSATKNGEAVSAEPVWTSTDDSVAQVAGGRVTVVGAGECYIVATVSDEHGFYVSARCKLIVGSEKSDADKNDVTAPDKDWGN